MTGLTIEDLAVGQVAEVCHTVTSETIRDFVAASGDKNPIHSDQAFAAATRFGRVIAPGMLTGSLVSGVIGTRLPGPGAIYLSQNLRFLRPVYVGDRVTARVEVAERIVERNRVRLLTTCLNQGGDLLLEGEAWVLPSRTRLEYAESPGTSPSSATLAWAPAALAAQLMGVWMASGLAMAEHALGGRTAVATGPRPEPDPVRP
jgi:3-hydroxybutyryl-CoA dehydratase